MMNLTFFTYFKILTIIFLIIIHVYLIFKEMEIINSELNTEKYKMSGILNNFTRNLKTAFAITIGTTTLFANSITIYDYTKNKALIEQEKALSEEQRKEEIRDLEKTIQDLAEKVTTEKTQKRKKKKKKKQLNKKKHKTKQVKETKSEKLKTLAIIDEVKKKNPDFTRTLDSTDKYTLINAENRFKMLDLQTVKQIEETDQLLKE